jgi:hypothetical protein
MILIDTSIWINIFRDKTQQYSQRFYGFIGELYIVLTCFQQLDLLQGCRNEREWGLLSEYLEGQDISKCNRPLGRQPPESITICVNKVSPCEAQSIVASPSLP